MTKMCGNCGKTDHKYVDCPYIDLQFPPTKKEYNELKEKAKKTRFTYGQLAQVYRRGQGAYLSSGSRNVSMAAWAMGRVNSFISGRGGARKADADILKKTPKKR